MAMMLYAATGSSTFSGNELLFSFVLLSVSAYLGYRISAQHQVLRGVTPWRFPSFLWAVICFAFGPFGLVVELLAELTTKPRLPSSLRRIAFRDASSRDPHSAGGQGGGATRPGSGSPRPAVAMGPSMPAPMVPRAIIDVEPMYTGPALPKDESGRTALFGWYADPLRRHELRYFDGRRWADFVADNGVRSSDPLES